MISMCHIDIKQTVRFGSVTVSVSAVRFGGSGLSDGSGRFGSRFARFHKKPHTLSHPKTPSPKSPQERREE